jgi:diketogulonate reductase-like aldo/keto reductase
MHPLLYQRTLLEYCRRQGIVVQAYSSFGEGRLLQRTANNDSEDQDNDRDKKEDPQKIAQSTPPLPLDRLTSRYPGTPRSAFLLHWALSKGMAVIPKSTHYDHIHANSPEMLSKSAPIIQQLIDTGDPDWLALDQVDQQHRFCWNPHTVA